LCILWYVWAYNKKEEKKKERIIEDDCETNDLVDATGTANN
jgi:hypothetical protein